MIYPQDIIILYSASKRRLRITPSTPSARRARSGWEGSGSSKGRALEKGCFWFLEGFRFRVPFNVGFRV